MTDDVSGKNNDISWGAVLEMIKRIESNLGIDQDDQAQDWVPSTNTEGHDDPC